jgi:cell wall-associated NlpC family hydrolase
LFRDRLLTAAIGGLLVGGSILGVAPGAQAAVATQPAVATQIAALPDREAPHINVSAIARANRLVGLRRGHYPHLCLAFVRTRYELPRRHHTAIGAWLAAKHKHRHDRRPPAGVPVFWSGGSRGRGHVAISLGHGRIISTDLPRTGHITRTGLSAPGRAWGLHYLGWTEDLEGVRIYHR